MSKEFNIQGGSASDLVAEAGGGGISGVFQPGVKAFQPGAKDRMVFVRFLPAFDPNLAPHDQSYRTSVGEYRLRDGQLDTETKSEAFSPWYMQIIAYTYLGNTKEGILSPLTLKGMGGISMEECACPIFDLQQKARNSDRPDWRALAVAEKNDDRRDLALPFQPVHVIFNALWSVNDKPWDQGILMLKTSGLKHLKAQLCWPAISAAQPLDPAWPHYCLGDHTKPDSGLVASVYKSQFGTVETYCAHLSKEDFRPTGATPMPVTQQHLMQRRILGSSETLKLLSYQEIVDWVLFDGFLPRDLVREACGGRANVPSNDPPTYKSASTAPHAGLAAPQALPSHGAAPAQQQPPAYQQAPQQPPAFQQAPQQPPAFQQAPQQPPAYQQQQGAQSSGSTMPAPSWATSQQPSAGPLPAEASAPPQGIDPSKRYAVNMNGGVSEGTWREILSWWESLTQKPQGVLARPTDLTHDWKPMEELVPAAQPATVGFQPVGQQPGGYPPAHPAAPALTSTNAPSQAPSGVQTSQDGGLPPAAQSPLALQQAHDDGIPGLAFGNGGPPSQQPVPAVAVASDPQPVPAGAPAAGGSAPAGGPLTPEEAERLAYLRSLNPASMTPKEVGEYSALTNRA